MNHIIDNHMPNASLKSSVLDSVNVVVNQFQENPYKFLYERDIQCALFSALRKGISETVSVPRTGQGNYTLDLIYSEYGNKIDLVCLDHDAITKLDRENLPAYKSHDIYIYDLPILVAIELKYVTMGYLKGFNILEEDYTKISLLKRVKNSLALCFLQSDREAEAFYKDMARQSSATNISKIDCLNMVYAVSPTKIMMAKVPAGAS